MNSENASARGTAETLGNVAHRIIELVQLQRQLFAAEMRKASRSLWPKMALMTAGVVFAICSIPVSLVTIALLLVEIGHLSYIAASACTILLALVIGGTMIGGGVWWIKAQPNPFRYSQEEWTRTVQCLKDQLGGQRRPA